MPLSHQRTLRTNLSTKMTLEGGSGRTSGAVPLRQCRAQAEARTTCAGRAGAPLRQRLQEACRLMMPRRIIFAGRMRLVAKSDSTQLHLHCERNENGKRCGFEVS